MSFMGWKKLVKNLGSGIKRLFTKKRSQKQLQNKRKKRGKKRRNSRNHLALPPAPKPLFAIEEFSLVQLSPHTQRAYRKDLRDFFAYLKAMNLFEFWHLEVGPAEIAQYRGFLKDDKQLSKSTITRKLAVLKSFYKWCHAQNWIDRNPAELVRSYPQRQDSKTGFLNESEILKLLNHYGSILEIRLSHALSKICLEILLMLGLRRSEACNMRVGDLEYLDEKWLIKIKGKGDRERVLPIPPRLCRTLCQWFQRLSEEAPLTLTLSENPKAWLQWVGRHKEQPILISTRSKSYDKALSDSEVARIIRKSSLKAGIVQRVSPHMLRSTAITFALDQGASHRGVQQMAGWTTPLMISRYDKRRNDPKFSAVHKLKYAQ